MNPGARQRGATGRGATTACALAALFAAACGSGDGASIDEPAVPSALAPVAETTPPIDAPATTPPGTPSETASPTAATAAVEEVRFTSGRFELVGDLVLPGGPGPHPAVVVVHGDGPQTRRSTPLYGSVVDRFGSAGYAVFSWDKPGSGASTGRLDDEYVLTERAAILLDAIEHLAQDARIDNDRIGLWGLSQAGWVMPMTLDRTDAVAFMVTVSGGGEDGIEQTGYQLAQNVRCAGGTEADADLVEHYMPQYATSPTYAGYVEAMEALATVPELRRFMSTEIADEDAWQPWPPEIDAHFDPMTVISHTTIPVLAVFGEADRYVDPLQGAAAYEDALATSGNERSQVALLPGVGHVMDERTDPCASGSGPTSEHYLATLDEWLVELDSS